MRTRHWHAPHDTLLSAVCCRPSSSRGQSFDWYVVLSRLLYVPPALLRRGAPFFALYLVLFSALTLADGLSLTLLLQSVGAKALPNYYACSAVCLLVAAGIYLNVVDRFQPGRVFVAILATPLLLFAAVWCLVSPGSGGSCWLGLLFIGRELAFCLVLLHFGAYLQQFFTRDELSSVMPVIYAGGRFGGIAGGVVLERWSAVIRPIDLLLVAVGALLLGIILVEVIRRCVLPVAEAPSRRTNHLAVASDQSEATQSVAGFLRFVRCNPLMFWITLTTMSYFACRAFISYGYSSRFEVAFTSESEMAGFIGRYTTYALSASLLLQLFVVNRLIAWAGVRVAHMSYAILLASSAVLSGFELSLTTAVFARFVEGELRYALRNPTAQLIVIQFSRALRTRARAWSVGFLIPISTFAASSLLAAMLGGGLSHWIGSATVCLGLVYFGCALRLARHCPSRRPANESVIRPDFGGRDGRLPTCHGKAVESRAA